MVVVGLVAGAALRGRPAVPSIGVALLATHRCVQPDQRETSQIVIEPNLVAPSGFPVTSRAIPPHTAGMDVIRLMATEAFFRKFLSLDAGGMTGMARKLFMLAIQSVLMLAGVVILQRLPAGGLVASGAVVPKPSGMGVLCRMAAMAGFRQLGLQVAPFVAGIARDLAVLAFQPEAGFLQMIKTGVFPAHGTVAILAGHPARTPVHVIGRVAGVAGCGRPFERGVAVTGNTGDFVVGAQQGESGFPVVETSRLEGLDIVALRAVRAELPLVNVICFVASDTGLGRVPMLLSSLVAGGTGHRSMSALQPEVGLLVPECVGFQADDICGAALVLTVTARATSVGWQRAAMKPQPPFDVRGDVLVTRQTQAAHAYLVGTIVAT